MALSPSDAGRAEAAAQRRSQRRKRWLIEAGLIFAFWTALALLTLGNLSLDQRSTDVFDGRSPRVQYTAARFLLWALLTPAVFWLCRRFPLDEAHGVRNAALHLVVAFAGAAVADLASDLLRLWILDEPDRALDFVRDLLELRIIYEFTIYLAVLAAGFARSYFLRLREREAREARLRTRADRLQRQLTEARLQALRMQLNPHFLFNTLHAVSTLVGDDPAGVRRMIARLSQLLRHVLDGSDRDEVPLREEMAFLRAYLDIMQIRFQGRLSVALHTAPDMDDALVPNLLLQPLVENAIKHGAGEGEGPGRVAVEAHRSGEMLHLLVRDDGPRFSPGDAPRLEAGTGLENVRTRLGELYGEAAALSFEVAEGGGLVAEVRLPFRPATVDPHVGASLAPA